MKWQKIFISMKTSNRLTLLSINLAFLKLIHNFEVTILRCWSRLAASWVAYIRMSTSSRFCFEI